MAKIAASIGIIRYTVGYTQYSERHQTLIHYNTALSFTPPWYNNTKDRVDTIIEIRVTKDYSGEMPCRENDR